MTHRRTAAIAAGAAAVGIYIVTATVTLGAGRPVRPLFEGVSSLQPYQWVRPPARFAPGNVKPGTARQSIPITNGASQAATVVTPEQQLVASFPAGVFPAHGSDTKVDVTGTPVDPATLGALPAGLDPDGNAYRLTFAYSPSGQAVTALTGAPGTIVLGVPSPATTVAFSTDGKAWEQLPLEGPHSTTSATATMRAAGYYLAAGPPGTVPVGGAEPKSDTLKVVLIIGGVVLLVVLLLGVVPALLRRGRQPGAPKRPRRGEPPLRPGGSQPAQPGKGTKKAAGKTAGSPRRNPRQAATVTGPLRWMRRLAAAGSVVTALSLLGAAPASAHTAGAAVATDYRSDLIGVVPPATGIDVTLFDLGQRIRLSNRTARDVTVLGYRGEPYLRAGPGGVYENRRSPTLYENRSGPNGQPVTIPSSADPNAAPQWHRVSAGRTVTWSDHRGFVTGATTLPSGRPRGDAHVVVPQWSIPMLHGDEAIAIVGSITWSPSRSPLPWVALAVVLAAAIVAGAATRRWGPVLSAAIGGLVVLDVVHAVGSAQSAARGIGPVALRLVDGSYLSMIAWVAGGYAVVALQRERESGLLAACFSGAVIAILSGFTDLPSLTRSQLPLAVPTTVGRLAVSVAIGAGSGVAIASARRLLRLSGPRVGQAGQLEGS